MTMRLSDLVKLAVTLKYRLGDVEVVLWDLETSSYYTLTKENFEVQRMESGLMRVSVGTNDFCDPGEDQPAERPIALEQLARPVDGRVLVMFDSEFAGKITLDARCAIEEFRILAHPAFDLDPPPLDAMECLPTGKTYGPPSKGRKGKIRKW